MQITDVHAHMDFDEYKDDLDQVMEQNKKAGVKFIVSNGVNIKSNRMTIELAEKYDIILPALGMYPTHVLEHSDDVLEQEMAFIGQQNIVAIGEAGLDYFLGEYTEHTEPLTDERKAKMKTWFRKLVGLAVKKNIPVIVHSRKAELETVELLEEFNYKKIIMHCFCGKKALIKRIVENGWCFSIPCNIVRAEHFQNIVRLAPLEQIFTETDSPYISPYRDIARNEPRFIIESLKKIAEVKGMDVEEVANVIFMNFQRMFL